MNRFLKQILCFSLLGFLAACGNHSASKTTSNTSPQTGPLSPSAPQGPSGPISPGNLPAPSAQSQAISQESFFQRKRTLDSFSSPLKKQVQANYQQISNSPSPTPPPSRGGGTGAGGPVVYNTLFGPVSGTGSKNFVKVESTEQVNRLTLTDQNGNTYKFADKSTTAPTTGSCGTLATQFLCVTAPVEGQGFVQNTIRVLGAVNIAQAALFAYTDPVAIISIFRQDGTPVSEFSVTASDLAISDTVTGPENARVREATFAKDLQLGGVGQYTLVVSSFKDSPDSVQMVSITRNIFYQDVPRIQLVSIEPPTEEPGNLAVDVAHRHDPVRNGAQVSMKQAVIKVALTSQGTDNVGIVFENYDEAGNRRYVSTGDADFSDIQVPTGSGLSQTSRGKAAKLPLYEGTNLFKVWVHNTLLESRGLSPATPSRLADITLQNTLPGNLVIQMRGNVPSSLVEATSATPQTMELQFCISRPPSTDCVTTMGEDGRRPIVKFNGIQVADDHLTMDSSGLFHAQVTPQFGNNTYSITAKDSYTLASARPGASAEEVADFYTGRFLASFNYGKLNKLYDSTGANPRYGFTERGVSLELARNVFAVELKKTLEKALNTNKQQLIDLIAADNPNPTPSQPYTCTVDGREFSSAGDTTIRFDRDSLHIGDVHILEMTPQNNRLVVGVRIDGLRGNLDMQWTFAPDPSLRSLRIPINLNIRRLTLQIGVNFQKNNGVYSIQLSRLTPGVSALTIEGGDAAGIGATVDSTRFPAARYLERLSSSRGLVDSILKSTIEGGVLCGATRSLNDGRWITELHNLIDTPEKARAEARAAGRPQADIDAIETNLFRLPLEFALFGKNLGLNVSYDLLHSDNISFDERGLHIWNMPVRLTPNNTVLALLNNLPQEAKNILGTIVVPKVAGEARPRVNLTDDNYNVALQLSEDAINQALSAANLGILSNVVLEPNSFTNANGTYSFIYQASPIVADFLNANADKKIDFNQNGVDDDKQWPVRIALKPDVHFAPHFHYLNQAEITDLNRQIASRARSEDQQMHLNPNLKYFRLSVANLGLEFYRVDPLPNSYKTFCTNSNPILENQRETNQRALLPQVLLSHADPDDKKQFGCQQSLSVTFPSNQDFCPRSAERPETAVYTEFVAPTQNGPVISAVPGANPPKPVVAMQLNLTLYGVIQGTFREIQMADKYEVRTDRNGVPVLDSSGNFQLSEKANPKPSNFVRIKLVPGLASVNPVVVENHTSLKEEDLTNRINFLVPVALGGDCQRFNEILLPIPDRYPSLDTQANCATLEAGQIPEGMTDADVMSLRSTCDTVKKLHDFGLHHLDLGDDLTDSNQQLLEHPELAPDGVNSLYLDLRMHLGMCLIGEGCAQ